jgi:hypothetical protein
MSLRFFGGSLSCVIFLFNRNEESRKCTHIFCAVFNNGPEQMVRGKHRPEYTDRAIEAGGTREGQSFVLKV